MMENVITASPLHTARYITIAMDIAERVLNGNYIEGQKISGRSTLSGLYNVSPETVRRALTLLQEAGVVKVLPGAGVQVNSVEAARDYLAESGQYKVVKEMQERLNRMVLERNQLNSKIEHLTTELLEYVSSLLAAKHKI
ncbi:MAG: GntR family transcriptional regulator [Desulfotomaculaceae bacterium]|nr:GntR family transcriptional regulator [Desulfotomaculaceae bacterium]